MANYTLKRYYILTLDTSGTVHVYFQKQLLDSKRLHHQTAQEESDNGIVQEGNYQNYQHIKKYMQG